MVYTAQLESVHTGKVFYLFSLLQTRNQDSPGFFYFQIHWTALIELPRPVACKVQISLLSVKHGPARPKPYPDSNAPLLKR